MLTKWNQLVKGRFFDYLAIGLFFVLTMIFFRGVIFDGGMIGLRHDWSVPETSEQVKMWFSQALYPWISARGGFTISYLSDFLVRLTVGLVGYIGIGGEILSRFYLIVCSWFSGIFAYYFAKKLTGNKMAALLAGLFYMFNPLSFNKYIAGHINYWIGYMLSPLFAQVVFEMQNKKYEWRSLKMWWWVAVAGIIFAVSGVQLHFLIMLSLVYWVMVWIYKYNFLKSFLAYLVIGLIATIIHLPWLVILAVEMVYFKTGLSNSPTTLVGIVGNASNFYQAVMMMGANADYMVNSLIENNLTIYWTVGLLIGMMIVLYAIYKSKEKRIWGWWMAWLISVFLMCFYRVFPQFSIWLLDKSTIFNFFREVYHLAFLTVFFWTWILAYGWNVLDSATIWQRTARYLLVLSLVMTIWPMMMDGKLMGNMQNFVVETQNIESVDGARTWFWPAIQPFKIDGVAHAGFDASIYYAENGSISQMGRYSPINERFATFLNGLTFLAKEKIEPVLPQILDQINVEKIVYRQNMETDLPEFTLVARYKDKVKQFGNSGLEWILKSYEKFKTASYGSVWEYVFSKSEKVVIAKPCYVTGEWDDLIDVLNLDGPAKCDMVLSADDNEKKVVYENMPVVLSDNNWFDLMLKDERVQVFEAGVYADSQLDLAEGWVSSERAWWYDPMVFSYPQLSALTEKEGAEMKIDLAGAEGGEYVLMVESLRGKNAGEIRIGYRDLNLVLNNREISENWYWNNLGELAINESDRELKITNINGNNVIGKLALIKKSDWDSIYAEMTKWLENKNKVVLENFEQIAEVPGYSFDLTKDGLFYENFPEYSSYQFETEKDKLTVRAKFGGEALQNEFATIIYNVKNYDLALTPLISVYSEVENTDIQFWEMGLEVDKDNDGQADLQLWQRLDNGWNSLEIADFFEKNNYQYDHDKQRVLAIRLQPHKEYGVDMNNYAKKEYVFGLSELKFMTKTNQVVRLSRMQQDYDMEVLKKNKVAGLDLTKNVNLYNDFSNTEHRISLQEENKLVIESKFSPENEKNEFATIMIDTNINMLDLPYMTFDLKVDDSNWQFYDVALMVDSDFDNYIDQEIWLDTTVFTDSNQKTGFVDLMAELMQGKDKYNIPRLLGIKVLAHRQYKISGETKKVNFEISNINFYHDGSLNQAEKQNLPVLKTKINVPQTGKYVLFLQVYGGNKGKFNMQIGTNETRVVEYGLNEEWIKVGDFDLVQGNNEAMWWSNERTANIGLLAWFKVDEKFGEWSKSEITEYQKISPVEYRGKIKIDGNTNLLFKESWHPAWVLDLVDSESKEVVKSYHPILVNGWEQGYLIDQAGEYDFVISYQLAGLYRWLLVISGIFTILLGLFLLFAIWQQKSKTILKSNIF